MKKKIFILLAILILPMLIFSGCDMAETTQHNIATEANKFNVYRKMTFVNLYTNQVLYSAEGYFSVKTSYSNDYQGQQEIALVFMVGKGEYKMDYFSIAQNVTYVIEQIENTSGNPYYWKINWYIALPQ